MDALVAGGVEIHRHLIGFRVREPGLDARHIEPAGYHALQANAADFTIERHDADIAFVPMERTDVQHSHAVVAHLQMRNGLRFSGDGTRPGRSWLS